MDSVNQASKVLRALKRNSKSGIPNYKFHDMHILCHTKVISNLRKEGHTILKERQYFSGKATGVYVYHLVDDAVQKLEDYPLQYEEPKKPKSLIQRVLHLDRNRNA